MNNIPAKGGRDPSRVVPNKQSDKFHVPAAKLWPVPVKPKRRK